MVFEHLGEILMNATRDSIDPAMRAAAEDICGDFAEIVPADTRNLLGFFVSLRQMLVECGVHDFSFADLVRPTHDRLVKIFSYTINFVRFRESQTPTIDENFNKSEATKRRIEDLYMENQDMEARLEEMKRNRKAMESAVKEKVKRNDELKARLLELRREQERLAEQLERSKTEKSRSQNMLEEKMERLVRSRQESESSGTAGSLDRSFRQSSTRQGADRHTRAPEQSIADFIRCVHCGAQRRAVLCEGAGRDLD
jgi:kinetochore protein Nuf2